MKNMKRANNGPIPGENFTSDTRNYPWHRPPEFSDLTEAMDHIMEKILEPKKVKGLMTALQLDMDIATMTDVIVTQGIAKGKWTPDYALLLAGPVSRIIELMAKREGIDYQTGWEDNTEIPDAETLKFYAKFKKQSSMQDAINPEEAVVGNESVEETAAPTPEQDTGPTPATGFAAPPKEGM